MAVKYGNKPILTQREPEKELNKDNKYGFNLDMFENNIEKKFVPKVPKQMHIGSMIGRLRDSTDRKEITESVMKTL